jgi:DcaP outer membrane protein
MLTTAMLSQAQSQEVVQLQEKVKQLEQMLDEVKGQIKALQSAQLAAARNVSSDAQASPTISTPPAQAPATKSPSENTLEIYGAAQLDIGYNFGQTDPNGFDVVRPTKLAAFNGEYAPDGTVFASVRQSRFGVKTSNQTPLGELKTIFEFELFGTGVDAGQTTFRLRHAYGELGQIGAGQTWSPFMDIDVFPNSLEYWGPNGMVFFRNLQARWMPLKGDSRITFAVERPGASADGGIYADRIALQGVRPKFDLPDFSGEGRFARKWGYVKVSGILRKISWVDTAKTATRDLSGDALGWGVNLSSNLNITKKDVFKAQVVYGPGIENYMNDAPLDVGVKNNFSNSKTPVKGVALPVLGALGFIDHTWGQRFSSSVGYSFVNIWNSNAESPSDFHQGFYGIGNLIYYPVKNVFMGGEFQYGRRVNFADGWNVNDYRLQFSFKYNFAKVLAY